MLIAMLIALGAATYAEGDSLTARDIAASYVSIFHLNRVATPRGDTLLMVSVVPPSPPHPLAPFVRENERWLSYLLQHGRGFELEVLVGARRDSVTLQRRFAARLAGDSTFNAVVLPAATAYLRRAGPHVTDVRAPAQKQVIPMERAIQIAVRFFYPDIITEERILTHVCTVINAVKELGPPRNLAFEALAFSAIMGEVTRGDSSRLEADFAPARLLMNKLDSRGTPDEVRLNRAQGVMWGLMAQSPRLREVLALEYAAKADFLPFIISPGG
jgi:hypothetical protein